VKGRASKSAGSRSRAHSNCDLYATRLTGSLLGVPLTFTPSTVSAVLLTVASVLTSSATMTMTNVTTDQPIVIAGALQTGQLSIG